MNNINLYINHCGSSKAPACWQLKHTINMQRLYYIIGGTGSYICDNQCEKPFERNKIYLFPYNLHVCFHTDTCDPVEHTFFDFISSPPIVSPVPIIYDLSSEVANSAIKLIFQALHAYHTETTYPRNQSIGTEGKLRDSNFHAGSVNREQVLLQMLHLLITMISEKTTIPFSFDDAISKTLDYIHLHYAEQITVKELAEMVGFEQNHFIRRFHKTMGVTPYTYLSSYRVMRATEFIKSGLNLSETAQKVGYSSGSSLSRAITNYYH